MSEQHAHHLILVQMTNDPIPYHVLGTLLAFIVENIMKVIFIDLKCQMNNTVYATITYHYLLIIIGLGLIIATHLIL